MNAFTLPTGEDMVGQGDFYGLMFFVVALAILVVYFLFGYYTNEVSQVSILPMLSSNKYPNCISFLPAILGSACSKL
jgi:hypothetical protein